MTLVHAETGELVDRRPALVAPDAPVTALLVGNQCRSIEVWAQNCDDIDELRDTANKLDLLGQYLARTSNEGRNAVAAARIRIEARIGELLGEAKPGRPSETSPASEVPGAAELTPNQRSQFRKMADHPEVIDAVIDESDDADPASRRKVLDEINKAKQADTGKPRRSPLHESAMRAGLELRKAIERVERIVSDDRFPANKEQVAAVLGSHLTYAQEVLPDLLGSLTTDTHQEDQ